MLQKTGKIDALIASCARFARRTAVLESHHRAKTEATNRNPFVFQKLRSRGVEDGLRGRFVDHLDVCRFGTLLSLDYLEFDLITLIQTLATLAFQVAVVNEEV